jgi:hypothetical protein
LIGQADKERKSEKKKERKKERLPPLSLAFVPSFFVGKFIPSA